MQENDAGHRTSLEIETRSTRQSFELGRLVGSRILGPCFIALNGDLGAGKTVFIQGLARGLEVDESFAVTSPSYTLVNEYPGRLTLFHVDLYRIEDPEALDAEIGLDEIFASGQVVAVEWAGRLPADAPEPDIRIRIETDKAGTRRFSLFFYGPGTSNLVEAMKQMTRQA